MPGNPALLLLGIDGSPYGFDGGYPAGKLQRLPGRHQNHGIGQHGDDRRKSEIVCPCPVTGHQDQGNDCRRDQSRRDGDSGQKTLFPFYHAS